VEPIWRDSGAMTRLRRPKSRSTLRATTVILPLLQGCAAGLPVTFDPVPAQYVLETGPNEISGRVATVSEGGYTRTCEDSGVSLLPVTPYWTAWAIATFGSDGQRYAPRIAIQSVAIDETAREISRHTDCDSSGRFLFEGVADGKYYVFSTIFWLLRWQQNGGGFLQEVEVRGGQNLTLSMIKDWRKP